MQSDPDTILTPYRQAAQAYQKSVLGTDTGPYNANTNSCVTHVANALKAGGLDIPTSTRCHRRDSAIIWRVIMPAIICKEHGRQAATMVCPHIQDLYRQKCDSKGIVPIHGSWIRPNATMLLFSRCSECSAEYGLPTTREP